MIDCSTEWIHKSETPLRISCLYDWYGYLAHVLMRSPLSRKLKLMPKRGVAWFMWFTFKFSCPFNYLQNRWRQTYQLWYVDHDLS